MAVATIVEKYRGTDFASSNFYGSWWFCLIWAMLTAAATFYFIKMRVRRASVVALHLSFVIILLGAFLTHVSSKRGVVHLRQNETVDTWLKNEGSNGISEHRLPFKLQMKSFEVLYHEGTKAERDFQTHFTVIDNDTKTDASVSMNNIFSYRSIRFYQSSYDPDMRGSILAINSDPWGIPITYVGYAFLFLSLLWMLIDPKGAYRQVIRNQSWRKVALATIIIASFSTHAGAATVLPKSTAEKFGELNILYNNRICPLQTFAIDFTKKLYGSSSYKGYTAEQVLTGFIFWGDEWCNEPIIKLKNGALRETLQLPKYVAVNTFFNNDIGGYTIGPYVREYLQGNHDEFHKQVGSVDDRLQLIMEVRRGTLLKVFPFTSRGTTTWYAPTDKIEDKAIDADHRTYINNVFSLIYQEALAGNNAHIESIVDKMGKYQVQNAGASLPTKTQISAERTYNKVAFATILFMINLTMGIITFFLCIPFSNKKHTDRIRNHGLLSTLYKQRWNLSVVVMLLSFCALTFCLSLRWIISGTIPMSNGYETMLLMAWIIMLCSLLLYRKINIILPFAFLMSGFFMLVSHINQMDPQISHIMPVLNSPLLCIHVSVIMLAFAMLSLTFICGLTAIVVYGIKGRNSSTTKPFMLQLQALSDLFLYPALAALGLGIFIGAIWANVSWGTYWSWDAKEVWALITFMIYAISLHRTSLPFFRNPMGYHLFMVFAFLSIIMTYFGVNYFLGGMHSYA